MEGGNADVSMGGFLVSVHERWGGVDSMVTVGVFHASWVMGFGSHSN